jgi:D-alanyl-D-alanine carboxypeptidase
VTEYLNLEKSVSISRDAKIETTIPRLIPGKEVSVHDLLILMLTESSNEAAEALASAMGREYFISLMNEKAKAIGLYDTAFGDPSGLSENNKSSARDLFLLLQYLYENRRFVLDITSNSLANDAYGAPAFGKLENFNFIKGVKDTFVGGKIGNTDEARQTYVGVFLLPVGGGEERPVGVVLLGSQNVQSDARNLLSFVDKMYVTSKR